MLIKNAEALERFEKVDTMVVDKSGTLTEGKPRVTTVAAAAGFDELTVLSLCASLELPREHPLAAAIQAAAAGRKVTLLDVTNSASITGTGASGTSGGRRVAVDNAALLEDRGAPSADLEARADALRREGATALFVAVDDEPAGVTALADRIKVTTMAAPFSAFNR